MLFRSRNVDNGLPIDSSGTYSLRAGGEISFVDINQLAAQLAGSCEVAQCLAQQLLADAQTAASVPMDPNADPAVVADIAANLSASGGELSSLVRAVVQSDGFLRGPSPPGLP